MEGVLKVINLLGEMRGGERVSTCVVRVEVRLLGPSPCRLDIENVRSALTAGRIRARLHMNVGVASLRDDFFLGREDNLIFLK